MQECYDPVTMSPMAYTQTDVDNLKAAILQAAIDGIASVTIGGHSVQKKPLAELQQMLSVAQSDLASQQSHFGMRMVKLVPPGAG